VLAAALDIRPEIRGYELKGTGDFAPVAPVCAEYGSGNDDDTLKACADMFGWLYGEGQKRAKRIKHYAELGKAPENKVTPELAALPGSGLHPMVVFADEIQELFTFGKTGKEAGETAGGPRLLRAAAAGNARLPSGLVTASKCSPAPTPGAWSGWMTCGSPA
jgi:S-DNA-T family DNA segregation ATPase FtsK/SpoIIIE